MPKIKSVLSHAPQVISNVKKAGEIGQEALRCAATGLAFGGRLVQQVTGNLNELIKDLIENGQNSKASKEREELLNAVNNMLMVAQDVGKFAENLGNDVKGIKV